MRPYLLRLLLALLLSCHASLTIADDKPACDDNAIDNTVSKGKSQILSVEDSYPILQSKLESVKSDCGEICVTDEAKTKVVGHKYYDVLEKEYSCERLFANERADSDEVRLPAPPRHIPHFMLDDFTYQGRVPVQRDGMNDQHGQTHDLVWPREEIERRRRQWREGRMTSLYGKETPINIARHLDAHMPVEGKRVLVLGSQKPWLEALLLEHGAAHVVTIDYLKIDSQHELLVR